jgi:hypothetical protein
VEEISHPGGADERRVRFSPDRRIQGCEDVGALGVAEGDTGEAENGVAVEGPTGGLPPKRTGAAPD